jgi:nucleotide-binding universal stress UspA family protein
MTATIAIQPNMPADPSASIASMMQRVMIQAERSLLDRAQQTARERGVSFPQLVREALERELAVNATPVRPLTCVGVISTGGQARARVYEPDAWR